jgi:serine/threonine-protein kinase RsbW
MNWQVSTGNSRWVLQWSNGYLTIAAALDLSWRAEGAVAAAPEAARIKGAANMPSTTTETGTPPAASAAAGSSHRIRGVPPLRLVLPAIPEAVSVARQLVRSLIGERYPDADALVLCVSELVTNAVTHSLSAAPGGTLTLYMNIGQAGVLVQIRDGGGPTAPQVMGDVGPDSERGRGLQLVEALADSWGSRVSPDGRVTWCRFSVHAQAATETPSAR